jgi:hypothetical protein
MAETMSARNFTISAVRRRKENHLILSPREAPSRSLILSHARSA